MKKKYIILTFMLFLLNIQTPYAACTQEEIKAFKKVEDEYTIKYEFNKTTKDYNLIFYSPISDRYVYVRTGELITIKYESSTETSITYSGVKPGEYKIEVVGVTESCDDTLKTITLNLPKYNSYSEDPICEGIEEFVLCQPTYDKKLDYDTFVSRVNTYKKSKESKVEEEPEQPVEENKILQYIKDNIIQIIIVIVFIILVLITTYITISSIRKSRRLE